MIAILIILITASNISTVLCSLCYHPRKTIFPNGGSAPPQTLATHFLPQSCVTLFLGDQNKCLLSPDEEPPASPKSKWLSWFLGVIYRSVTVERQSHHQKPPAHHSWNSRALCGTGKQLDRSRSLLPAIAPQSLQLT